MKKYPGHFVVVLLVWQMWLGVALAGDRDYRAEPESLYSLMDKMVAHPEEAGDDGAVTFDSDEKGVVFYRYSGHPEDIYLDHPVGGIHVVAPPSHQDRTNRIITAYQQGAEILKKLYNITDDTGVYVFLTDENIYYAHAVTRYVGDKIVIALDKNKVFVEHTFLHEYMHALQHLSGKHPPGSHDELYRWYTEGSVQFAPLITSAPENWINNQLLYGDRFATCMAYKSGRSLTRREECATLFWYYYYKKVLHEDQETLGSAFRNYADKGFKNEHMDWFNFKSYWHDFALACVHEPGEGTNAWRTIDPKFDAISTGALAHARRVIFPLAYYGGSSTLQLLPLTSVYLKVKNLGSSARGYVIFSLPDRNIPDGVEISALLQKSGTGRWTRIRLDKSTLGKHWVKRFPVNGKKVFDNDAGIPYDRIAFVISNASDTHTYALNPVITNHFKHTYKGRGIETHGAKYMLTGTATRGTPRVGDGYRLTLQKDRIHTHASTLWFRRVPELAFDKGDNAALTQKAIQYLSGHAMFRGDVYFKYIAVVPEKVTRTPEGYEESGKWIVKRERKEHFYTTPNRFKVPLDNKDIAIMAAGGGMSVAALTHAIAKAVNKRYSKGTFGGTMRQLFLQTMALDTRAYHQEYDIHYKKGIDRYGEYLKIRLGQTMWFTLRP